MNKIISIIEDTSAFWYLWRNASMCIKGVNSTNVGMIPLISPFAITWLHSQPSDSSESEAEAQ